MVLELCTGGELFDRIATLDHYSEKQAARAFVQMNEAIGHCHEHGIVHARPQAREPALRQPGAGRDAQARRLRLRGDPEHRGLAAAHVPRHAGVRCARDPPGKATRRAVDMWSLGVIPYVLLCGFPPFQHENTTKLFKLIKRAEYEFPSPFWDAISSPAKDLICRPPCPTARSGSTADQVVEHAWMSEESQGNHLPHFAGSIRASQRAPPIPRRGARGPRRRCA